ncbi:hypothetical protein KSP40_PGU020789 [Platanthera guangdongensis]|uniref:AAA+ ATPase domain-containing protein n=1 Tax=Platanthera guangdongensis TaxID=2320717 RepID=A0ABR2MKV7_9ASPA
MEVVVLRERDGYGWFEQENISWWLSIMEYGGWMGRQHEDEGNKGNARNQELVKMQEESSIRQEQIRRATEEQIQAHKRQTERERAEIERETIRVKAMAEAEGRAHEAKLAEDVNRRMLLEKANAEREKWVSAINTTFEHIGGDSSDEFMPRVMLKKSKNYAQSSLEIFPVVTDELAKLLCLDHGILFHSNRKTLTNSPLVEVAISDTENVLAYTREGARVVWGYVDRILGQPSLIRESSRGKYPWSGLVSRAMSSVSKKGNNATKSGNSLGDVVLHPSLQKRVEQLAKATSNTKAHQAPFRNMLFYGPPGTGKTMVARELARKSTYMSEAQRSALNALLFRTGDQSKDIVLALATNRPGDLDSAVADRIDEVLEFPLPGEEERFKLLSLYLDKYIARAGERKPSMLNLFKRQPQKIEIKGITDDILREAAAKTEGFSGREIAKLMASVQAAVYGSKDCELTAALFREVVDYKVAEHQQRKMLAGASGMPDASH